MQSGRPFPSDAGIRGVGQMISVRLDDAVMKRWPVTMASLEFPAAVEPISKDGLQMMGQREECNIIRSPLALTVRSADVALAAHVSTVECLE